MKATVALVLLFGAAVPARAGQPEAPVPAGQLEPPVAAPGESVPPHAAGGWPTETTGDAKKPARSAEQQAAIDEVANSLKATAKKFGPDSVVLQAKFLMRSTAAGALGPTEVRVVGPSAAGPEHLEIDVETGIFFSGKATTAETRREAIWRDIAIPVLDEMLSFKIEPANLELVFFFDVQDEATTPESIDPTAGARHEAFHVRLDRAMLNDMIVDTIVGDAVRSRAQLTEAVTVARPPFER